MGQATGVGAAAALDAVVTNALIIDAALGVVKAGAHCRGADRG